MAVSITLKDDDIRDIGPRRAKRPQNPVINDIFLAQAAVRREGHELDKFALHPRKFERLLNENGVTGDLKTQAMRDGLLHVQGVWVVRIGDDEGKTNG